MNTLLNARSAGAERVNLRHDDVGGVWKTNGSPPNQGRSALSWLKATVRTIDARRDDLVLTHWKKVWRSMQDDGWGGAGLDSPSLIRDIPG